MTTTPEAAATTTATATAAITLLNEEWVAQCCRVASPHHVVCKEECVYTFHTPLTSEEGIVVNLNTFIGTIVTMALPEPPVSNTTNGNTNNNNDGRRRGIFLRIVQHHVPKQDTTAVTVTAPTSDETKEEAPVAAAPTKLGIGIEGGFPNLEEDAAFEIVSKYSIVILERVDDDSTVRVVSEWPYEYNTDEAKSSFPSNVVASVDSILHHAGMAVQQDVQTWQLDQEPIPISKYAQTLPFVDNGVTIDPDPSTWKCQASGATDNLWLNLSDGYIGGGRKHWDGSGGSNGALDHYQETGQLYPLVVKLGTITADISTADCYSYAPDEDGPVRVPNLVQLLEQRGIKVASMQKTVKSTVELEVELNATYAFDAITEAGSQLQPVWGPTLQGLQNLGNSCYMNSVVQLLLSGTIPELAHRYGFLLPPSGDDNHSKSSVELWRHPLLQSVAPTDAALDILCQTTKLSSALTSGAFASPPTTTAVTLASPETQPPRHRLRPRMFKQAIGGQHVDFRTGQQQDAAQYLQYLLEQLDRAEQKAFLTARWTTPTTAAASSNNTDDTQQQLYTSSHLFAFQTTERLVCTADQKIKYKTNPAPDTIWSLRIPMDQAVVEMPTISTTTTATAKKDEEGEEMESSAPDQKRPKKEEDEGEGKSKEKSNKEGSKEEEKVVPTVTFQACVDAWAADTMVDGIRWSHLNQAVHAAQSQTRFANFPRYLLVQVQRYMLGPDWTPIKLEVNLDIPQDIDLTPYKASGPQPGEELVPPEEEEEDGSASNKNKNESTATAAPAINEEAVAQLMDMGFSRNGCIRALMTVGGDPEAAMNWILEHCMDDNFNDPVAESGTTNNRSNDNDMDEGVVMSLVENLGCFTMDQVRAALKETNGAADRAADWLFSHMDDLDGAIAALQGPASGAAVSPSSTSTKLASPPPEDGEGTYSMIGMISHIGKHTGSGHYVAHLKRPDLGWVIFNDDKVAISESPPFHHAYLYLFQRKDTITTGKPQPNF